MAIRIITASGKGGVGKSTICKGLALQFSDAGKKTLLVDCDAGLSSLDVMLGVSHLVNFTWSDILSDRCETKDALLKVSEKLTFLPSPKEALTEDYFDQFSGLIKELDEKYEIIILDAPAGLGRGLQRAAKAASHALIVATADEVSVKGAEKVNALLQKEGITQSRLLINRYDIKAAKKGKLLTVDEIIDKTLVQLIGIVPDDKNIVYSTVSEKPLKTKRSAKAFSRISARILGEKKELTLKQLK
ncbi:MAG: septum site-determining protein MinD [Ruminococcaceae bacterium]|nr:septum site-determining protein MinD [Oscillospiraceae bacterium]